MLQSSRRHFIQSSAVLVTAAIAGSGFISAKYQPKLSFSTLGCPDWDFNQIVKFATTNGYTGIELRGIKRELDLTKCDVLSTPAAITATNELMKKNGLQFVDLGSSCTLHFPDGAERQKNLDEGRKFIDLAQQINCPYVRVYPNNFPKGQDKMITVELIIKGLIELGKYAKEKNVTVLMETHGDLVNSGDLEVIMQAAGGENVGLVWDAANMWTVTKEAPEQMYSRLKKYIHHAHIKDASFVDGKLKFKFLGKGEVPIFAAIDLLAADNYSGFYSFEWEKLWHPEIEAPELALADYPKAMKQHFK